MIYTLYILIKIYLIYLYMSAIRSTTTKNKITIIKYRLIQSLICSNYLLLMKLIRLCSYKTYQPLYNLFSYIINPRKIYNHFKSSMRILPLTRYVWFHLTIFNIIYNYRTVIFNKNSYVFKCLFTYKIWIKKLFT